MVCLLHKPRLTRRKTQLPPTKKTVFTFYKRYEIQCYTPLCLLHLINFVILWCKSLDSIWILLISNW